MSEQKKQGIISVLLPTRGRTDVLLKSLQSLVDKAANHSRIELILGIDEDDTSLNSRILYNQSLFQGKVRLNTALETNNGVIARQEFTYVQVDPGNGIYTWNDYNNNGIQELEEFEIAQFQDEGTYVRVLLPNQFFQKIRGNKYIHHNYMNNR